MKEQVLMTATAQNIKRIVKLLSEKGPRAIPIAVQKLSSLSQIKGSLRILDWLNENFDKNPHCDENCFVET